MAGKTRATEATSSESRRLCAQVDQLEETCFITVCLYLDSVHYLLVMVTQPDTLHSCSVANN